MQHWVKGSVALSLLLAGCSTSQVEQDSKPTPALQAIKVPAGLQQPAQPGQFDIPPTSAKASGLDTRAPAMVLATAASSRMEEGDKLSRVWFDRNDYTGDLLPFLQQMLKTQFAEQGVDLLQQDEQGLDFVTGWITRSEEQGFWFWKSSEQTEQARFSIKIDAKPHGRSASMSVTMLEHQYFTPEAALSVSASRRQEVALLNQIIDRIGKEEIIIARANKAKAPDVSLEPGMDKDGNPALITSQPIDVTWSQLEALFGELSLNVTDINRSTFTYYLDYEKPAPGFWSRLWSSDEKPVLPLDNGEYQLVLSRSNEGTSISLRDKAGAHLAAETMLALHEPFVQAIRLARIEL
ncbi:outer membrane protein assembly factor BamC [Rheinheimera sp. NSM]|uniref:outer membrane protein assembly factor BamC n=1 Tax=Rheinheimera sp. NSM TaxID=3457884 RepID=UPI00403614FE